METDKEYLENRSLKKENGCLEWQGCINKYGYGMCSRHNLKRYVHRFMYELTTGPVPEGMVVMHLCDNPRCICPDHLKAGTRGDNMKDMINKGRGNFAKEAKSKEVKKDTRIDRPASTVRYGNPTRVKIMRGRDLFND